jgi:hypothetical protein
MKTVHMAGMGVLPGTEHVTLAVDETKQVWSIELNPSSGKGCRILCRDLTSAGNLMNVIEQAINSGEITGMEEF